MTQTDILKKAKAVLTDLSGEVERRRQCGTKAKLHNFFGDQEWPVSMEPSLQLDVLLKYKLISSNMAIG